MKIKCDDSYKSQKLCLTNNTQYTFVIITDILLNKYAFKLLKENWWTKPSSQAVLVFS